MAEKRGDLSPVERQELGRLVNLIRIEGGMSWTDVSKRVFGKDPGFANKAMQSRWVYCNSRDLHAARQHYEHLRHEQEAPVTATATADRLSRWSGKPVATVPVKINLTEAKRGEPMTTDHKGNNGRPLRRRRGSPRGRMDLTPQDLALAGELFDRLFAAGASNGDVSEALGYSSRKAAGRYRTERPGQGFGRLRFEKLVAFARRRGVLDGAPAPAPAPAPPAPAAAPAPAPAATDSVAPALSPNSSFAKSLALIEKAKGDLTSTIEHLESGIASLPAIFRGGPEALRDRLYEALRMLEE